MTMTIEEAKKMVGTEFIYEFEDGDTIKAYVKAFDPKIGLTCFSLETETRDGWKPIEEPGLESDGTFCVIGVDVKKHSINDAIKALTRIKKHSIYKRSPNIGSFSGCAF